MSNTYAYEIRAELDPFVVARLLDETPPSTKRLLAAVFDRPCDMSVGERLAEIVGTEILRQLIDAVHWSYLRRIAALERRLSTLEGTLDALQSVALYDVTGQVVVVYSERSGALLGGVGMPPL